MPQADLLIIMGTSLEVSSKYLELWSWNELLPRYPNAIVNVVIKLSKYEINNTLNRQVYPFAGIAEATLPGVPRILFNKEACGPFVSRPRANDVAVEGKSHMLAVKHECNNQR